MTTRKSRRLHPLEQLRDEMDRLFTDFFRGYPSAGTPAFITRGTFPAINLWEAGDELFAEAELPGVSQDSLDVYVSGDELTIQGERSAPEEEDVSYHRRERGSGKFTRVIRLPVEVEADKIEATLSNGVFTIKLPKAAAAKPRKIHVNAT